MTVVRQVEPVNERRTDSKAGTEDMPGWPGGHKLVRGFKITVIDGTERGRVWKSAGDRCSIGSHHTNDVIVEDATVSRFHCEIVVEAQGTRVRDQASRNGTIVDGLRVDSAWLKNGSLIRLGRAVLRFDLLAEHNALRLSARERFGALIGDSVAMRATFALLERAASSAATVLLEGETGTGKGAAAEAIHQEGARRDRPFVVVDASVIPANLLEAELFGHERGAFTGADVRRIGAFEEARGGTVFLDEIGEISLELQPKLLRVLESREVRRIGQNGVRLVDVRLIAATNRDLRAEVNAGRFRADLYFRLAVLKIPMPPLRARPEDVPTLARGLLDDLGATRPQAAALLTAETLLALTHAAWPGNVRELRNYLERCLVMQDRLPIGDSSASSPADAPAGYADARRLALESFEREFVVSLLAAHGGKVTAAARAAGMARVYLYRLMRRHGLKP